MSNSLTFEAEPFELSPPASGEKTCHCAKCQAQREQEFPEDDETAEDFAFEDEIFGEYAAPPQGASYGSGQASYGAAAAWAPLTAEKICWVQNVLNRAEGENLKPDGIFGPLTRGAVQRFQSRQSLKTDGIVGPQTETALIQTALNTIGQASLVPVNGTMDARTHQEIRRFQTERRLVVDGIVGPVTRTAMIAAIGGRCQIAYRPPLPPPPKREKIPHQIPIDPRTPIAPPPCNRTQFDQLILQCDQEYRKCVTSRCGVNWVISQLKEIPGLIPCTKLKTYPLIILCALAKGGKGVIDNIINAKACKDTCAVNSQLCRVNAGSQTRCR